jgi:hypothetical protein
VGRQTLGIQTTGEVRNETKKCQKEMPKKMLENDGKSCFFTEKLNEKIVFFKKNEKKKIAAILFKAIQWLERLIFMALTFSS